tara:strand:- start:11180 stop:12010 length:831 start_codon:yes stop_codon:yes gene_type:complete
MRVLIDFKCGRAGEGLSSSFFWVPEVEVITWMSDSKPAMDMFDEAKPDILIVSAEQLGTLGLKIASSRYPNTKIVSVGEVVGNVMSPHLSVGHTGKQMSFPMIPFSGGAMLGIIGNPSEEESLSCDVLCMTDYVDISNQDNISYLEFVCENYNTKIFGPRKVEVPNYLGLLSPPQRASALASASVYLDLDGESWYDAAWLGKEIVSISDSSLNFFKDIDGLKESIDFCLSRKGSVKQEIKRSVANATYFDLTYEILSFLGLQDHGNALQQKKKELL